jgi:hypothetical protein
VKYIINTYDNVPLSCIIKKTVNEWFHIFLANPNNQRLLWELSEESQSPEGFSVAGHGLPYVAELKHWSSSLH